LIGKEILLREVEGKGGLRRCIEEEPRGGRGERKSSGKGKRILGVIARRGEPQAELSHLLRTI